MNGILIPSEAADAYIADDAAIIIADPPQGLPPQMWRKWAEDAIVLPVVDVLPIRERGRGLLKIVIGDALTKEGKPPKVFRLGSASASLPQPVSESLTITIEPTGYWRQPLRVSSTGSLPPPPSPSVEAPRCTKPVRVWPETHRKLKALSAKTGMEIAQLIGKAVDAFPRG